ncbi:hypothetical protein H2200_003701 [Cladophialophora chaetospira]|uniref:Pisatin demethylase n=1 Tax=Cladophialophora chaetospira TaxID=386627 RepID=A0AA38XES1_9EURO|nr:hypothetical protein H2200_003701 [Cladophialophora chaetospira]
MDASSQAFVRYSKGTSVFGVTVCFLVLVAIVYLAVSVFVAFRPELRNLPGPILARFSGIYRLTLVYGGQAPFNYRRLHQKYGTIVRVGPNHVSVSDPAVIPQIYGIGANYLKTSFYKVFTPFYQGTPLESLFSTQDPMYHKSLKKPVANLFSMTNLRYYEVHVDEGTQIFIDAMDDLENESVDLSKWLQWYAFDVIASITFQRRFGFMERRCDVDNMIRDLDLGGGYIKVVTQFPELHQWLIGNKTLMGLLERLFGELPDAFARFMKITEQEIARYNSEETAMKAGRTDFLAQLREKEAKDGQISFRDMMNHLSNNIIAGSDTTAISLRAVFYYLLKTPMVYKKLVTEIGEADSNKQLSSLITFEESLKLSYLQAVMKEALRIHPGVAFPLERYIPPEGATICGVKLRGGTNISVNPAVIHMSKEVYGEDADQFRPERWIEASPQQLKQMDRSFLTFGHGARTCIGKNISTLEMGKFIPQILRHFDLDWVSPQAEWNLEAAWFWKQSGMLVKFKRRVKSSKGVGSLDDGI